MTMATLHLGTFTKTNVQLAKAESPTKLKYPLLAQLKYDGVRLFAFVRPIGNNPDTAECVFYTRNGMLVPIPELSAEILEATKHNTQSMVLDGELAYAEGLVTGRTKVSGRVNSAIHGGHLDLDGVIYCLFDCVSHVDWIVKNCNKPYEDRLGELKAYVNFTDLARLAYGRWLDTPDAVSEFYQTVLGLGYEGLILKHPSHLYTFKRTKAWSKMKAILSADLECIDVKPGKGKYEGMIGSLLCKGLVEGKDVVVHVSGMDDAYRAKDPKSIIRKVDEDGNTIAGKTIEVLYNGVIPNHAGDGHTLFLPRFKCERFDK